VFPTTLLLKRGQVGTRIFLTAKPSFIRNRSSTLLRMPRRVARLARFVRFVSTLRIDSLLPADFLQRHPEKRIYIFKVVASLAPRYVAPQFLDLAPNVLHGIAPAISHERSVAFSVPLDLGPPLGKTASSPPAMRGFAKEELRWFNWLPNRPSDLGELTACTR
jgi:hypothetical protein